MDRIDKDEELVCPLCGGRLFWMPVSHIYACEHCKQSYSERNGVYMKKKRKSTAEKSSAVGDVAKLREALEFCVKGMCGYCRMDAEARGMTTECVNGCEALLKAKAALAAPPRNCDVGDAADWEKRFGEECDKGHICSDCPVRRAKTRMAIELDKGARCEFVWAQMPYEEGGAK